MPTSKTKNLLYRMALPVISPAIPSDPVASGAGRPPAYPEMLSHIIRKNHISGAAVHLRNSREYCSVFTRAVHTDMIPDEHTFFRVASVTKMATALLSVRLMDMGLLDPEKPLAELLPDGDGVPEISDIRFCQLLSHTSGLSDPPDLEAMLNRNRPYTEAVSGCRTDTPGKSFRYSNLGYGLIGCVLEYLMDQPLEQIYQDYLFRPLGMNATLEGCSLPSDQIMPVIRMLPYRAENALTVTSLGRNPLHQPDPLRHYGHSAGSMYTDLPSLTRLVCCIRDGGDPLLSRQYSWYMKKEVSSYGSLSPTLAYGSGLLIIRDRRISDAPVFGHQGFAYGCVDGAFWEEATGNIIVSLNGGCSEARTGRLGIANLDLCRWAFRKEMPKWK